MSIPDPPDESGVVVPLDALRPETLRAVVEEFVTREGTDYGPREFDLDAKVEHVLRQLRRGEAQLSFDAVTGTVGVIAARRR